MQAVTNVIEAISHSNARSELRLDTGRVYSGNLRLGNLGCVTGANSYMYNQTSGVLSLIDNIYIYDGSTLLDQLQSCHNMVAFRNLQQGNAYNFNINQQLTATTNAFEIPPDPNGVEIRRKVHVPRKLVGLATNVLGTTFKGWLNLFSHFNVLQKLQYNMNGQTQSFIDTNVFPNFRIIIEWRSPAELVSCFAGVSTNVVANILPPQLFADEYVGLSLPKEKLAVQYFSYELDKMVCIGSAGAGNLATKSRLNGFNGKFLNKILMMNVDPAQLTNDNATGDNGFKCDCSEMFQSETLQLYINGKTIFDANGIDTDARRLSILTDAWGSLCIAPFSAMYIADTTAAGNINSVANINAISQFGFWGCVVQSNITEFVAEHQRTVPGPAGSFNMYFWGEVVKTLQIENGAYIMAYA